MDIELRYNHNHDEKGRFCSGVGASRVHFMADPNQIGYNEIFGSNSVGGGGSSAKSVDKSEESGIIKTENQKRLLQMIANNDVTLEINSNIQDRHYQGTSAYKTFLAEGIEESYFLVPQSDLQEILYKKHATGSVRIDSAGVPREIIDCGKTVAYDTKLKRTTSFVKVHYSKKKTHLSPHTPNE